MAARLNCFSRLSEKVAELYDPVRVFYYNYWFYVFSGFWKYKSSNRWRTILYKYYQNSIIVLYAISMILFIVDAVLARNDFYKLSFNMSSSVLVFMKVIQIGILSRLRESVIDIHERLDNHLYVNTIGKSEDDKLIFKKKAEYMLSITVTFYGLLAVGLPLRVIADTALEAKTYIVPMPFSEKLDSYYPYVYTQQVLACFHFMMTTLSFDLMEFTLILRFIAHYEVLEKNISKIKALYERTGREKEIKNFSEIYSRPFIIQLCGLLILSGVLTLQIIFLSNKLSVPFFMQQVLYALTALLHILYLSSFGSELTSKSVSTADALYDTPWYEMNIQNRKIVYLIMQRLMQGTKLKGGRMINIDRPMSLKFSYNMVALLRKKI